MIFVFILSLIAVVLAGGCQPKSQISNTTFAALMNNIDNAAFPSDQIKIVKKFVKGLTKGFSGRQTAVLIDALAFPSDQNTVVKTISPWLLGLTCYELSVVLEQQSFPSDQLLTLAKYANFLTDTGLNNQTVLNVFAFPSDQASARKLLRNAKPVSCLWGDINFRDKIVFVVDVSGSMSTTMVDPDGYRVERLEFAVQQLANVLRLSMGSSEYFNIIMFDDNVDSWQPSVVPATSANVRSAINWLSTLRTGGNTAMFKALTAATSDPSAEGIVLLSDGIPNCCQSQIISLIQKWTARGNAINTVLLESGGAPQTQASQFMCQIAVAGNGLCRTNA
eukprot:Plantae.Rhodophyta-Palmaria_palmata.ctg8336.p1 GENE.Plantae.Rhodophyta-Palmaria_palmata.ctg8336~~Plantae.Rhodophyta-Palmaria_palmata.ctg8336.p1  ORF type:complete len:335 (-),score=39.75 Plantae.Rhodophyta-Palmaria_palmata.ctg8336:61-1065(-)